MKKKLRFIFRSDFLFFSLLSLSIIVLFRRAFGIGVFKDDYSFFHLNKAKTIVDFFKFFSPIRDYPYRPLPSNLFYYILNLSGQNIVLGHVVVFITYLIGLVLLYKIIKTVTKNPLFSKLSVLIYAFHFSHVFQLYWLATFEEILMFTCLVSSFYFYLKKKFPLSIVFFIAALLSKETAMLYVPFLFVYEVIKQKRLWPLKNKLLLGLYTTLVLIYYFGILHFSLTKVTGLDNYKIDPTNIRLLINNAMWYLLWSLGLPNFMPDVMRSVFSLPLPVFKKYWADTTVRAYFYFQFLFLSIFGISVISLLLTTFRKKLMRFISVLLFLIISFYVFLGPILFFRHKWMVRLMIPQLFMSIFMGWVIYNLIYPSYAGLQPKGLSKQLRGGYTRANSFASGIIYKGLLKTLSYFLLIVFFASTVFGIQLHESSSLYLLETRIYKDTQRYFSKNGDIIKNYKFIYFKDKLKRKENPWGGSEKLKVSFHDQDFLDYFLPGSRIKAVYGFETKKIPDGSYIVDSYDFLK